MVISYIKYEQYHYLNIHAEISYFQSIILNENNLGIYSDVLDNKTLSKIIVFINELKLSENDKIILDFDGVKSLETNCHTEFLNKKTDEIILKNISKDCAENLILNDIINSSNEKSGHFNKDTNIYNCYTISSKPENLDCTFKNYEDIFKFELSKQIELHCLKEVMKTNELSKATLHHSSSIYLPFYFDTKQLLTKNKLFFMLSVYYLAKDMKTNSSKKNWFISFNQAEADINQKHYKKITLFCQNLNSSFIASLLSRFLLTDLMIIDHIGPINRIYNEIEKKVKHGEEYITVGDVVCIGTEVIISKNIIEFSGGTYIGNVSLIRIMTLMDEHRKKNAFSLFEINKKLIEDSEISSKFKKFKISTALD